MSKHTPGPWHWDSDPIKGDLLGRVRYRVVTAGKTITQCYYSSSDEQAEWDARLIASAPAMLEALEDLVALAEDAMRDANRDGGEYDIAELVRPVYAVIRAARGEA